MNNSEIFTLKHDAFSRLVQWIDVRNNIVGFIDYDYTGVVVSETQDDGFFYRVEYDNLEYVQSRLISVFGNTTLSTYLMQYEFNDFWPKTKLKGIAPYLDFDKYMIFGWTPGYTRKDCSKVYFEKLIYKDGCLLVLIDFADDYREYVQGKRPLKIAIFPKVKPCDVFIFKKIKKGWRKYEWKPILTMWDMSGIRQRPFQIVMVDKEEEKPIQLATYEDITKIQNEANQIEKQNEQESILR